MCVTHPNRSTSAPYKPVKNARLFSPLGVSRGLLLLLLLACFIFTPSTSQAYRRRVGSSQNGGKPIQDVTPAHRKLSEVRTDLRDQLNQMNGVGKQSQTLGTTTRKTSTSTKPSLSSVQREILREKCVQLVETSSEARSRGMEQVRATLKDFLAWIKILDGVEFDVEKFDDNVMILLEKYTAVISSLEWVDSGISAELSLYGKVASGVGRSRTVPTYSTSSTSGGRYSESTSGNSAQKKDSREAGILAKCSAEIAKLKEEQDTYNSIRKSCERKFNAALDDLLQAYVEEMSGMDED